MTANTLPTGSKRALLAVLAVGCAPPLPPTTPAPRSSVAPVASAATAPPSLPPLSARETELRAELERDVEWLAGTIGERHLEREWDLASATDGLVERLEAQGHAVQRLGVVAGDAVAQNLEVVVHGGKLGTEQVVVGAHYDTARGSPGADDNASGVAAVLAIARSMRERRPMRTLRLVFFCNEEEPHFGQPSMGSLTYATRLVAERARVVAMLSLESLGYYVDAEGSQRYPREIAARYPDVGNFLAVVANERSRELLDQVLPSMQHASALPIVGDALPEEIPGVGASDHWAFWKVGFPALMITDTAPYRNPHYHAATDRPATLDLDRFARAARAVEAAVASLIGVELPPG